MTTDLSFASTYGYCPAVEQFSPDTQGYLVATAGPGGSLFKCEPKSLDMPEQVDYMVGLMSPVRLFLQPDYLPADC